MTISSTTNRVSYAGDGSTTAFSFPHRFLAREDLTVILVVDSTGVETTQTLTTDYTVTGTGDANGGTVNMVTAPATGETLVIINDPDLTQGTDLADGSALPAESVETVFDRLTIIAQRIKTLIDRSFVLSDGDTSGASTVLPTPTGDKYIGWNDGATALENKEPVANSVTLSDNEVLAKEGSSDAAGLSLPVNSILHRSGGNIAQLTVPANSLVARLGGNLSTLAVAASRIVGRGASGALKAMTSQEVRDVIAKPSTQQVFTADGTWNRPSGCKYVRVQVQGAGGGAPDSASNTTPQLASGGGGGGYCEKFLDVSGISSSTVTVGSGAKGSAGEDSSWADGINTLTGSGGGVSTISSESSPGDIAGSSGASGGSASGGDVNITGGDNDGGLAYDNESGAKDLVISGRGGNSVLGSGGASDVALGSDVSVDSNSGRGYGSGASGAGKMGTGTTQYIGAAGQDGIVIVTEYYA